MQVTELASLLKKVEPLRLSSKTEDIALFVEGLIGRVNTPSMGQSVCEQIISMCNPKAWGDRQVDGFGANSLTWQEYLDELSQLAERCGQAIYDDTQP